jgi:hypothetical protein
MSEPNIVTWAMFDRDVLTSTYLGDADTPLDLSGTVGKSIKIYDEQVDGPIQPMPKIPDFVNKDTFLFELLSMDEQLALQFHVKNIDTLGEWDQAIPSTTGGLYRGLDLASQQLDNVEQVQLSSPRTTQFLTLCGYLGVFTSDPAVQAQRIADITIARKPDGTYIND